jgi:hypothetical protein
MGAAAIGTSVYLLPDTEQCRADIHWLQREIVKLGGKGMVFSAEPRDPRDSRKLIDTFKRSREDEYRSLIARARKLHPRRYRREMSRPTPARRRAVRGLRERLDAIARIDFFHARGGDEAAALVAALHASTDERHVREPGDVQTERRREPLQNRRWVTRPRPSIDRISSAWLIRRYIDPHAAFAFTLEPGPSDVPFDMPEIGFTHRDGMCIFETLVEEFAIRDAVAVRLSRIVHDLDLKDSRYGLAETASIGRVIEGLRGLYSDDHVLLEQGINFFDVFAGSQPSEG